MGQQLLEISMPFIKQIIEIVLMLIVTWIGLSAKNFVNQKEISQMDENKKSIVRASVRFAETVFKELDGPGKFQAAKEEAIKGLNDAGLPYTEDEIERLIQSAVAQFNGVFKEGNRHEK